MTRLTWSVARVVCIVCIAALFADVSAEAQVPILDMTAADVAKLLAQNGISVPRSSIDPENDGTALVDFIRWYESMPPIARFIEAHNPNACKAWSAVARWMEKKQQTTAEDPGSFWEWHSHNLRLFDMWMLPLTLHPPSALLWAALGNVSSATNTLSPIRSMGKLDLLFKWLAIPSYPLFVLSLDMLPQSNFIWVLVVHFGVGFMADLLSISQIVLAIFRGSSSTKTRVIDQTVEQVFARAPRAAYTFAMAGFWYYCIWYLMPLATIRLPMYFAVLCHALIIPYTAYFVVVEMRALFVMSRKGPDFDADLRVRPFNPAILSGATDIIAVRQSDGSIRTSPFHVRFGWISGVIRGGDIVDVHINGEPYKQMQMIIGSNGIAQFQKHFEFIHSDDGKLNNHQKIILKPDQNKVLFVPTITFLGRNITKYVSLLLDVNIEAFLHLWEQNHKVVICDIDGTITKTDSVGHLLFWARKLRLSTKDFTHEHVVDLLTAVVNQKYKIMYLTARNIGYANQTKSYIHGTFPLGQVLPRGPVITSHSGLIAALSLEILLKRPDEFKIAELSEIRALFGAKCSSCDQVNGESVTPFYAGFGNRPTDTKSYKRVGVETRRIFIVDVHGQVTVDPERVSPVKLQNYGDIKMKIDEYFPVPMQLQRASGSC